MSTRKEKREQEKRAYIMVPVPSHISKNEAWLVVQINGNMRWRVVVSCSDKWDAMQVVNRYRKNCKKLGLRVCNHLAD